MSKAIESLSILYRKIYSEKAPFLYLKRDYHDPTAYLSLESDKDSDEYCSFSRTHRLNIKSLLTFLMLYNIQTLKSFDSLDFIVQVDDLLLDEDKRFMKNSYYDSLFCINDFVSSDSRRLIFLAKRTRDYRYYLEPLKKQLFLVPTKIENNKLIPFSRRLNCSIAQTQMSGQNFVNLSLLLAFSDSYSESHFREKLLNDQSISDFEYSTKTPKLDECYNPILMDYFDIKKYVLNQNFDGIYLNLHDKSLLKKDLSMILPMKKQEI